MNQKIKTIFIIVSFVVVIILLNVGYQFLSKSQKNEVEKMENKVSQTNQTKRAIDFTVYDENDKEIKLSDLKGKPIIINFWASWCGPCKTEMPEFEKVYQKEKDNIEFLMINVTIDDTKENAKQYIQKEKFTFPVYYDIKGNASYQYGITGYPTTVLINKDFEMTRVYQTMINEETLIKAINEIK